jgi:spore maturation protein CgeB
MRLMYFGTLGHGSTSRQRASALQSIVDVVHAVDLRRIVRDANERGLTERVLMRAKPWWFKRRVADLFLRETYAVRPEVIWVDQGLLLSSSVIREVQSALGVKVVHYTPDSIHAPGMGRVLRGAVSTYDLCITTKMRELPDYRALGAREVLFTFQGFDPGIHLPPQDPGPKQYTADAVFVGQCMRERREYLEVLARQTSASLRIYGRGWRARRRNALGGAITGQWLSGREYGQALGAARIGLCFLNTEVGDDYTTRSFEIPACGVFMLAQRSRAHEELFVAGVEVDFFASPAELVEKVAYYLEHPDERERIAAAGREKVWSADWTWEARMSQCIETIELLR